MDIHNELKAMIDINLKTEFDLAINEVIEKSYQEDAKELGSKLALIVKSQWIQMKPYLFLAYCLGAKAQAVPEAITIGNELQSWVAVNSFSADDGEGVLPVVDANAIAEKIEELTGANQ